MSRLAVGLVSMAMILSVSAMASESKDKKQTVLNFEDELVEGRKNSPDTQHVLTQKSRNFNKLIKMRENFSKEMNKSGESVK